jgi:ribose/xylose/arabinose/galactoside ABC-type transport system permease subunit
MHSQIVNRSEQPVADEGDARFASGAAARLIAVREAGVLGALVVLCIVLSLASPYFFTLRNISNVLQGMSTIGIMAVGATMVLVATQSFLSGPALAAFLAANPHVRLDLFISDEPVDIVTACCDGGIRPGEVIDRDMIAVPVSGDLWLVVIAAPAYLAAYATPTHPGGDSASYRSRFGSKTQS